MENSVSIISADQTIRANALRESRLKTLVSDKAQFAKLCEAALMLLDKPQLRACDESSIMGALYKAVTLKCRLEPEFGECYLIPRTINVGSRENPQWVKTCVFQLGYKFWKAKALEGGHVVSIQAHEVFKEDDFEVQYGTGAFLRHRPAEDTRGETAWFYVYAKLRDGQGELFEAINKFSAEKYRRKSESQYETVGSGANKTKKFSEKPKDVWATDYSAMALRLPMKRLCAALPMTEAVEEAMKDDGSVVYLNSNGQQSYIPAKNVEEAAQPIETAAENVAVEALSEKDRDAFEEWASALGTVNTEEEVWNLFQQFKDTHYSTSQIFSAMFFTKYAAVAENAEQLAKFYHANKHWQKTPALVRILTDRKSQIEKPQK